MTLSEPERVRRSAQEQWTYAIFSVIACVVDVFLLGSVALGIPHNCGIDAGFGFTLLTLLAATLISYGMAPAAVLLAMAAIGYRWTRQALRIELLAITVLVLCAVAYSIVPHPNAQSSLCGFRI